MTYESLRLERPCSAVRGAVRFTFALLTILCVCGTCSAAPLLSGEWASTLALDVSTETWSTETGFTVELSLGDCLTAARSVFEDDSWKKQEFEVEATIANFTIESGLRFEPYKDRFKDWITEVEWETDLLVLTLTTKLTRTTDWLMFEIEHEGEMLEIETAIRFRSPSDSCKSVFYDASVDLQFDWCGIDTDLEIAINDDGFDEMVLDLSELALVQIPWFTFDLEFTRTAEKTMVKLSPDMVLLESWGSGWCELEIEGDFTNSSSLHSLVITEAVLTWEVEEWELEATAILNPSDWISKTYWLVVQAEAGIDLGDCGEVLLELTFLWTEIDLGRARWAMAYEPYESFTITIEGDLDLENGELDRSALSVEIEW